MIWELSYVALGPILGAKIPNIPENQAQNTVHMKHHFITIIMIILELGISF